MNRRYRPGYARMTCQDCVKSTRHEYYMVTDAVWLQAGNEPGKRGELCIGCLEHRIGRKLNRDDFTDCPLNRAPQMFCLFDHKSKRLWNRLHRWD